MGKTKAIIRLWSVTVDQYALDSSPLAQDYAERLVDLQVAASKQSLQETLDELKRIHEEIVGKWTEYDEKSRGFHRSAMYKGKSEGFMEIAHLLVREIDAYEKRLETNKYNNGHIKQDL